MLQLITIFIFFFLINDANATELYILFSNNCNGILESCYCPSHPFGGYTKRLAFIKEFRRLHKNVLVFDSGDSLTIVPDMLKNRYMMEALRLSNYDAIGLGDQDLVDGVDFFLYHYYKNRLPFVNCNIKLGDSSFVSMCKSFSISNIKIAVTGILSKDVYNLNLSKEVKQRLKYIDYREPLKEFIKKYRATHNLLILLSHCGLKEDKEIANTIDGIDLIIGAHSGEITNSPVFVNNTIIVQAGSACQYIGVLKYKSLKYTSCKIIELDDIKADPEILNLLSEYEKTLKTSGF